MQPATLQSVENVKRLSNATTSKTVATAVWRKPIFAISVAAFLFMGVRGYSIAKLLNGRYGWNSLFFDAGAAIVILLVLQLSDALLVGGLQRLVGDQSRLRRSAAKGIRLLVVGLFAGTFLLATIQMHPPKVGCTKTPADFGMAFSEHKIETSDGLLLSTWTIPAKTVERPVVVVAHGLGANKQNFLSVSRLVNDLDYNVVTFDFRGHGDSQGHTCSLGVREGLDVKAAYDFAANQFPNRPIYAWSTSMGGAATLRATAEYQIFDKIVVDASFSGVKNLAMDTKFGYLGPLGPFAWNLSRVWFAAYVGQDIDGISPERDIATIDRTPIFLIHGTGDPVIPHAESKRLSAAAVKGTELWLVEGAGHSGSCYHPEYGQRLTAFFD